MNRLQSNSTDIGTSPNKSQTVTVNAVNGDAARRQDFPAGFDTAEMENTDQPLLSPITNKRQHEGDNAVTIEYRSRSYKPENATSKHASKETGLSPDGSVSIMTTRAVYKNLIIYSMAFMFLFTALSPFSNIQSSVNIQEGRGTTAIATLYTTMVFTNLCVTLFTLPLLSYKRMTVASMLTYSVFYATGFYSTWGTLIPASIIIGFGASHLWPTQQAYVTQLAVNYSRNTTATREKALNLFFGIFMGIFQTAHVWGNLSSSLIFGSSSSSDPENITNSEATLSACGPHFCPMVATRNNTIVQPPIETIYIFTAFCVAISIVAALLVATLVTNVFTPSSTVSKDKSKHRIKQCCTTVSGVFRHLMTSRDQQLLVPVSILSGVTVAFVSGDFTVAYVSCLYGVNNVGYVMIAYGVFCSACSLLVGKLGSSIGSLAVIFIGMAVKASALLTMLLWLPGVDQIAIVFILASVCGVADGLFGTVILSLYSEYFMDGDHLHESLSSFRLLSSIGWAVSFGYSSRLCMRVKITILLSVTVVSGLCLVILNFRHESKKHNEQSKNQPMIQR